MYTRSVKGKEIELQSSGKLYKDALVMFDRQTSTLWTQVDGKALQGPLSGQQLEQIPALRTTWKTWKTLHPDTLVLSKPLGLEGTSYYKYDSDAARCGVSGTRGDSRLAGKARVVGVRSGDAALAIPLSVLEKKAFLQTELPGLPLVVFYSSEGQTVAVFRAVLEGRKLSFHLRGRGDKAVLEDAETGSRWSPLDGRAIAGPWKGKQLEPVLHMVGYWYAWSAYWPHTQLISRP